MTLNADQLLAKLYALRKDYDDDRQDETYQALHHAFLYISYNMAGFKDYVKKESAKATADSVVGVTVVSSATDSAG